MRRKTKQARGPSETKFEVRVTSKRGSKLFDYFDSFSRAKRAATRLTEAGITSAIVKVTRRIIWHHSQERKVPELAPRPEPLPVKPKRKRKAAPSPELATEKATA